MILYSVHDFWILEKKNNYIKSIWFHAEISFCFKKIKKKRSGYNSHRSKKKKQILIFYFTY